MSAPRVLWVLGAVAACGDQKAVIDATSPRALPMHVIVDSGGVQVYLDGGDMVGCQCQPFVFPAAGACESYTDANPCEGNPYCSSCITDFGVEQGGVRLTPRSNGQDPRAVGVDAVTTDPLTIVIEGCGHPSTRIAIDGAAFPTATATADWAGGSAHASWTTDASEALVTLRAQGGPTCRVAGATEYTFPSYPTAAGVDVVPLGARAELDTELGHATIWRAGFASAQLPPP